MLNPFYTHREFLIKELESLKDNPSVSILEFGIGDGSSEILNEYAKKYTHFKINGYEGDIDWMNRMEEKFKLDNYSFHRVNWETFDFTIFSDVYDLVFIDQAPWEARIKTLDYFYNQNNTKNIILHDYDFFNKGIVNDIFSVDSDSFFGKYINKFNIEGFHDILPPTLILKKI
jgi:hypothetical protein